MPKCDCVGKTAAILIRVLRLYCGDEGYFLRPHAQVRGRPAMSVCLTHNVRWDWEDKWRVRQRDSRAVVSRRIHAQLWARGAIFFAPMPKCDCVAKTSAMLVRVLRFYCGDVKAGGGLFSSPSSTFNCHVEVKSSYSLTHLSSYRLGFVFGWRSRLSPDCTNREVPLETHGCSPTGKE